MAVVDIGKDQAEASSPCIPVLVPQIATASIRHLIAYACPGNPGRGWIKSLALLAANDRLCATTSAVGDLSAHVVHRSVHLI